MRLFLYMYLDDAEHGRHHLFVFPVYPGSGSGGTVGDPRGGGGRPPCQPGGGPVGKGQSEARAGEGKSGQISQVGWRRSRERSSVGDDGESIIFILQFGSPAWDRPKREYAPEECDEQRTGAE